MGDATFLNNHAGTMKIPINVDPDDLHNFACDNLFDPEDDHDENEFVNWKNNPVAGLFDHHRQASHRGQPLSEEEEL